MKHVRYNTGMILRNKLILTVAAFVIVGGAGTGAALTLRPEENTPKTSSTPVNSQVEPPVEEHVIVANEPPSPAIVEEEQQEEQPVVETVDSVLNDATNNL